jgi:glycine/D-amino acid oxidase-like deaminating enzyme
LKHTAHGYWLEEAGPVEPAPAAAGDLTADVVILGGGYTGMWTAWHLLERGARVVLLEADVCGHGPSGRNGGFCETLWSNLPSLRGRFDDERALAACEASSASVREIFEWCEAEGVDAWFRRAGFVLASTSPAQDRVVDEIVTAARDLGVAAPAADESSGSRGDDATAAARDGSSRATSPRVVALDHAALAARCESPLFRRGLFVPDDATVQPARLALGLRRRLLERGVAIHEHSRARALRVVPGGVVAETAAARVRAPAAVLALNAATRGVRPLRSRLSVTSSHIVLTEPVPDVLESVGWTGGESITDGRLFVHYFRTTPDGRIAFGWGGGRLACGARLTGRIEVDRDIAAAVHRHLVEHFPGLEGRRITHAWGGPIDVSPTHLPQIGTLPDAPVHYAFGYTGNGVGPSHMAGRALADLAVGDPAAGVPLADSNPGYVPPEPLAWLGGMAVRAAHLRAERLQAEGRAPDRLTRAITAAPRALGIHVSR